MYCPAAQAVQPPAPVVRLLYVPARQPVHTDELVAAVALPKAPAAQAVQPEAPVTPLYAPSAQAVHPDALTEASAPYRPAAHALQLDAPGLLKRPGPQAVHAFEVLAPGKVKYKPAGQRVHTPTPLWSL